MSNYEYWTLIAHAATLVLLLAGLWSIGEVNKKFDRLNRDVITARDVDRAAISAELLAMKAAVEATRKSLLHEVKP